MDHAYIIAAVGCVASCYAMLNLWRNRRSPGAFTCMAMFGCAAVYVVSALRAQPTELSLQLSFLAGGLISPLLFIAVKDYTNAHVPFWQYLKPLSLYVPLTVALMALFKDDSQIFQTLANEADMALRIDKIRAARQGALAPTTGLVYAFTLLAVGTAVWRLFTAPHQKKEMLAIIAVPLIVIAADMSYYFQGFLLFGAMPTPFAMTFGLTLMALTLYRSRIFDLRPIARSTLIDNVQDGMLVVDEQQRLVDYNHAALVLLEAPEGPLIGRAAGEIVAPEITELLQTDAPIREEIAIDGEVERQWLEVDVTPLIINDSACGHLLIARDITARRVAQEALQASQKALEAANQQLIEQSVTDPLTGLRNRRFLFERLQQEVNRHRRSGNVLSLLVVDIDHFKQVNDTHGHPAGDRTLQRVANAIQGVIRENDVAARIGGEEFAIIAVDTNPASSEVLAQRVCEAISAADGDDVTEQGIQLTASIGVAYYQRGNADADRLFSEADLRLYEAKNQGRNRVVCGPVPDPERDPEPDQSVAS